MASLGMPRTMPRSRAWLTIGTPQASATAMISYRGTLRCPRSSDANGVAFVDGSGCLVDGGCGGRVGVRGVDPDDDVVVVGWCKAVAVDAFYGERVRGGDAVNGEGGLALEAAAGV